MKPNPLALRAELARLYDEASKHSSYQSIPDFIAEVLGYQVEINQEWRGDRVRLDYIAGFLANGGHRRWADVGANTGFFTLNLAHADPERQLLAIEANPTHAAFISRVAAAFEMRNVDILPRPIGIDDLSDIPRQDVLLHLNVLHHAGADFDRGRVNGPDDFLDYAREYLTRLRDRTRMLVFQVGTNLWGDKAKPFVPPTADAEKLALLSSLLGDSGWRIDDVAFAGRDDDDAIAYRSLATRRLDDFQLHRHVGEFYRRPLFFCSSGA